MPLVRCLRWPVSRCLFGLCQLARPQEHRVEHGFGEDAGEGVLLGGVIAAEEDRTGGWFVLAAVGEPGLRPDRVEAQSGVPSEGAETDENPPVREQFELAGGVGETGVTFGGGRSVLRRGAADGSGDPEPREAKPIVRSSGDGCVREAGAVERAEEEIPGAVAGEVAAGAVRPVCGRSQAEDDHAGFGVPKPRDRATPVLLPGVSGLLLAGDLLAPLDEARAEPAGDYLLFEPREPLLSGIGKNTTPTPYSWSPGVSFGAPGILPGERSDFTRRSG